MKVFDLEGLGQSYGLATTDLLRQVSASYALIDINGTKYRCMIGNKLFVEDGEV
jgi:hypothetical protein